MSSNEDSGKLGVILVLIMAIVMTIVVFNGITPQDEKTESQDIYIPPYSASEYIDYIYDGDTFKTVEGDVIRLLGVNTEEKGMEHADAAKQKLEMLLNNGEIRLERDEVDKDRYGRLLRHVWSGDVFVNVELVRGGYAHVYIIEPNVKYSAELWTAQDEAVANQQVLWEPSPYDVELMEIQPVQGTDIEGLNLEKIVFRNNDQETLDISGWNVKDESVHIFRFNDMSVPAGGTVELKSGLGTDTTTEVYWQLDSSIWNNAGDVCFLRDENGLLVDSWRYTLEGDIYVFTDYVP
ncbi:MAG: thermonuclease family protein [Candidatus Thermoplasmatota archaeon]|nr:thermonuclease family protein [Candidatus Thermoplasmatota archaeon]MBU4070991.1 thermonuclease family protein [Candidatus Thermoplasmatota archaeon]MBU4144299.1 thermonuclease family protein [Candidatus Thermoplasmatota archaeon]MBU4592610.1 thermonuclease family protein [Candidatus Thermoplasmatota archaeon]